MTDIKEPINTTSDGIFLSMVCENPPKSVVGQKLGGCGPPAPQELPPCISFPKRAFGKKGDVLRSFQSDWFKKNGLFYIAMNLMMLYFAIPVWLLQNRRFCLQGIWIQLL